MSPIQVPQIIEVGDYHDFEHLQEDYRKIIPGIKVKELGYNPRIGFHIGIIYLGTQTKEIKAMIRTEKAHLKKIEEETDYNSFVPIR